MIIDFKEIPLANKADGLQDTFELFARDFLEEIGYKIIQHPARGADGKKDMIVSDTRKGVSGETIINWVVSCKHYAHSGGSITDNIEQDIRDRIDSNKGCTGFIGVYSTLPGNTLINKLSGLIDKNIEYHIYDREKIEKLLLKTDRSRILIMRYFPNSFLRLMELDSKKEQKIQNIEKSEKENITRFTLDEIIDGSKTAIILLEIDKIKEEFFNSDWTGKENAIEKLYKFSKHRNKYISEEIIYFMLEVSYLTRSNMRSCKLPFNSVQSKIEF